MLGLIKLLGLTKLLTGVLAAGWLVVTANVLHYLGRPLPLEELVVALSVLIVASFLVGQVWIQRGAGYYKAMRLGETIGREKERLRR